MPPRRVRPAVTVSSAQTAVRVPRKRIAELVAFIATREGAAVAEVDVAVVGRQRMGALHRQYLGRSRATDVLSFDLSEGPREPLSAQIVVCGPIAAAQARQHKVGVQRELLLYVAHGLLHLLGYRDDSARRAAALAQRQEELLDGFLVRASRRG